jgi:hypothetical protein
MAPPVPLKTRSVVELPSVPHPVSAISSEKQNTIEMDVLIIRN